MMIERVKLSVEKSPDEQSHLAGAKILHQFFVKHKNRLQSELHQLGTRIKTREQVDPMDQTVEIPRMDVTTTMPASVGVPPINHECWQKLIDGKIDIKTNAVGLQMMLERVRLSIQRNPTDNNRAAGIKILHQYFLKHQARHREEIQALLGNVVETSASETHQHIPNEDHPNWQKLIDGETGNCDRCSCLENDAGENPYFCGKKSNRCNSVGRSQDTASILYKTSTKTPC